MSMTCSCYPIPACMRVYRPTSVPTYLPTCAASPPSALAFGSAESAVFTLSAISTSSRSDAALTAPAPPPALAPSL
eukprot:6178080-Pleurochrysis_carterae.AAC.4